MQNCTVYNGMIERPDAGTVMATMLGAGVVSTIACTPLLARYRDYISWMRVLGTGLALGMVWTSCVYLLNLGLVQLYIAHGFIGACVMPCLPIVLELSVEFTHPVAEDVSAGFLFMSGQVVLTLFVCVCVICFIEVGDNISQYMVFHCLPICQIDVAGTHLDLMYFIHISYAFVVVILAFLLASVTCPQH